MSNKLHISSEKMSNHLIFIACGITRYEIQHCSHEGRHGPYLELPKQAPHRQTMESIGRLLGEKLLLCISFLHFDKDNADH